MNALKNAEGDKVEAEEEHGKYLPWYMIDPDSNGLKYLSMLLLCFVVYTVFFMPFRLAFDVGVSTPDNAEDMLTLDDTWFVSDLIMDIIFTFDVFLRFFTAVPMPGHEHDGVYLTHIPDILVNYFHNGLLIDLISSLPLDLFYRLYLISGSPSPPAIIGQLLKLMRCDLMLTPPPPPTHLLRSPAACSSSFVCAALWASS